MYVVVVVFVEVQGQPVGAVLSLYSGDPMQLARSRLQGPAAADPDTTLLT